jgi:hypothetical protein
MPKVSGFVPRTESLEPSMPANQKQHDIIVVF